MKIDRKKFFDRYRAEFGKIRYQSVVDNINTFLEHVENDKELRLKNRHVMLARTAYILATVYHETGWPRKKRFSPVAEFGRGLLPHQRKYGKKHANGHRYYGRGYVQLTWADNYKRVGKAIGVGGLLYANPDLLLRPDLSYKVLSEGMRRGLFTGKRLSTYIKPNFIDFINARRIINGTDKAQLIARYARRFLRVLEASAK